MASDPYSGISIIHGLVYFFIFNAMSALMAYLIGSIPFAVVVSKLMGLQDPRSYGSKNPGATNVLRSGSKTAAALTLLGDAAKGWFAVWLTYRLATHLAVDPWFVTSHSFTLRLLAPLTALAVFLGHLYPIFLKFKGGKGVATALGVLLAISPWLALAVALTWLLTAVVSRYSSLAALVAAICAPIYYWAMGYWMMDLWAMNHWLIMGVIGFSPLMGVTLVIIALLLVWRHKANIQRLLAGTEGKIGAKKNATAASQDVSHK